MRACELCAHHSANFVIVPFFLQKCQPVIDFAYLRCILCESLFSQPLRCPRCHFEPSTCIACHVCLSDAAEKEGLKELCDYCKANKPGRAEPGDEVVWRTSHKRNYRYGYLTAETPKTYNTVNGEETKGFCTIKITYVCSDLPHFCCLHA